MIFYAYAIGGSRGHPLQRRRRENEVTLGRRSQGLWRRWRPAGRGGRQRHWHSLEAGPAATVVAGRLSARRPTPVLRHGPTRFQHGVGGRRRWRRTEAQEDAHQAEVRHERVQEEAQHHQRFPVQVRSTYIYRTYNAIDSGSGTMLVTPLDLCRCQRVFCARHRHPESHSCSFDYKEEGRRLLQRANPPLALPKLPKI